MKFSKLFWERAVWVWLLCFPLAFAGSFSTSVGTAQINNVLASPGPIGSVTPNTGSFSTIATPSVAITGGTITGITGTSTFGGGVVALSGAGISSGAVNASSAGGKYNLNSTLLFSATAPTIASGFGTSPTITFTNGTSAFRVNVGTGGTAFSGLITMPAAATGWNCEATPSSYVANTWTQVGSAGTTTIQMYNFLVSTGASAAWPASATYDVMCVAR